MVYKIYKKLDIPKNSLPELKTQLPSETNS